MDIINRLLGKPWIDSTGYFHLGWKCHVKCKFKRWRMGKAAYDHMMINRIGNLVGAVSPGGLEVYKCAYCGAEQREDLGSWNREPYLFFCSVECHTASEEV